MATIVSPYVNEKERLCYESNATNFVEALVNKMNEIEWRSVQDSGPVFGLYKDLSLEFHCINPRSGVFREEFIVIDNKERWGWRKILRFKLGLLRGLFSPRFTNKDLEDRCEKAIRQIHEYATANSEESKSNAYNGKRISRLLVVQNALSLISDN